MKRIFLSLLTVVFSLVAFAGGDYFYEGVYFDKGSFKTRELVTPQGGINIKATKGGNSIDISITDAPKPHASLTEVAETARTAVEAQYSMQGFKIKNASGVTEDMLNQYPAQHFNMCVTLVFVSVYQEVYVLYVQNKLVTVVLTGAAGSESKFQKIFSKFLTTFTYEPM